MAVNIETFIIYGEENSKISYFLAFISTTIYDNQILNGRFERPWLIPVYTSESELLRWWWRCERNLKIKNFDTFFAYLWDLLVSGSLPHLARFVPWLPTQLFRAAVRVSVPRASFDWSRKHKIPRFKISGDQRPLPKVPSTSLYRVTSLQQRFRRLSSRLDGHLHP